MNKNDIFLLESRGWMVVCESPLEIEHENSLSFANGDAVYIILESLKQKPQKKQSYFFFIRLSFNPTLKKRNNVCL